MEAIHKRIAGIDVHRLKHVVTVLIEDDEGEVTKHTRGFGGFKRDMKERVAWRKAFKIELAILESTGIYWKSVFASKYKGLVIRRGHKKAIVALAHKLIRTIFFVLTRRQPYRDPGFDDEAASVARNAPRWIKALKKFGLWQQAAPTAA